MKLETTRLILREWQESDLEPFAAMNADDRVMEFFPSKLTRDETLSMVERIKARFAADQFCFWAVEEKATNEFVGFVGLGRPHFEAKFMPCVEIGWRLAYGYWGKGYAPEAAREALRDGFERFSLPEIVAFTAAINQKSIRVMEKIAMKRNVEDDFMHPFVEENHPLKPHVLYRISQSDWRESQ